MFSQKQTLRQGFERKTLFRMYTNQVKCKEIRQSKGRQQIKCEFESQLSVVGAISAGNSENGIGNLFRSHRTYKEGTHGYLYTVSSKNWMRAAFELCYCPSVKAFRQKDARTRSKKSAVSTEEERLEYGWGFGRTCPA